MGSRLYFFGRRVGKLCDEVLIIGRDDDLGLLICYIYFIGSCGV